jgi:hypothetical protein
MDWNSGRFSDSWSGEGFESSWRFHETQDDSLPRSEVLGKNYDGVVGIIKGALNIQVQHSREIMLHGKNLRAVEH